LHAQIGERKVDFGRFSTFERLGINPKSAFGFVVSMVERLN